MTMVKWDVEGATLMRATILGALDYYFDKRSAAERAAKPFASAKCGNTPIPCGKDDAIYLGARAIFDTYGHVELCSKLLFKCSTNTAESGNCVLWVFWLPRTMLKPRTAAFMQEWRRCTRREGGSTRRRRFRAAWGWRRRAWSWTRGGKKIKIQKGKRPRFRFR